MTTAKIKRIARKLVSKAMKANETAIPQHLVNEVKEGGGSLALRDAAWMVYRMELELDPSLRIPATPKSVVRARDKRNLRWERIVVRAGLDNVEEAKALYVAGGGDLTNSWIGRGTKRVAAAA